MKRVWITVLVALFLVIAGFAVFVVLKSDDSGRLNRAEPGVNTPALTDDDIRAALSCDRMTADYRSTDPLCTNVDYARQLFRKGITFGIETAKIKPNKEKQAVVLVRGEQTVAPVAGVESMVTIEQVSGANDSFGAKTDGLGVLDLPRPINDTGYLVTFRIEADTYDTVTETVAPSHSQQYLFLLD